MKYTSFDYLTSFIVLVVILAFGVFEWQSANFRIAVILTVPLLILVFLFKNTYEIKTDHLAVSTFGKTYKKIWLRDIEKVEIGKSFFGQPMAKVYYSPYDYVSIKLGDQTEDFVADLRRMIS